MQYSDQNPTNSWPKMSVFCLLKWESSFFILSNTWKETDEVDYSIAVNDRHRKKRRCFDTERSSFSTELFTYAQLSLTRPRGGWHSFLDLRLVRIIENLTEGPYIFSYSSWETAPRARKNLSFFCQRTIVSNWRPASRIRQAVNLSLSRVDPHIGHYSQRVDIY